MFSISLMQKNSVLLIHLMRPSFVTANLPSIFVWDEAMVVPHGQKCERGDFACSTRPTRFWRLWPLVCIEKTSTAYSVCIQYVTFVDYHAGVQAQVACSCHVIHVVRLDLIYDGKSMNVWRITVMMNAKCILRSIISNKTFSVVPQFSTRCSLSESI